MILKQSSYTIKRDLLQELLEVLNGSLTYDDGGILGINEDVQNAIESLSDEIKRQDYMAQAVGLINENPTA